MGRDEFGVTLPEYSKGSHSILPGRSDRWTEQTDLGKDLVPFREITSVSKGLSPIQGLLTPLGVDEMAHRWARHLLRDCLYNLFIFTYDQAIRALKSLLRILGRCNPIEAHLRNLGLDEIF